LPVDSHNEITSLISLKQLKRIATADEELKEDIFMNQELARNNRAATVVVKEVMP
jgi:hypothetical protein